MGNHCFNFLRFLSQFNAVCKRDLTRVTVVFCKNPSFHDQARFLSLKNAQKDTKHTFFTSGNMTTVHFLHSTAINNGSYVSPVSQRSNNQSPRISEIFVTVLELCVCLPDNAIIQLLNRKWAKLSQNEMFLMSNEKQNHLLLLYCQEQK